MAKGFLARHGAQLIDNGYRIVPIRSGTKRPLGEGWQHKHATLDDLEEWTGETGRYKASGVGIITKFTPAVDIDCLDEAAADHMQAWIEERTPDWNFGPVRIGHAPKKLILFRSEEPFPKINSPIFEDPDGDPTISKTGSGAFNGHWRKVEILGDGQQFVAFAIHPDTGKPFQWVEHGDPLTRNVESLPLLTQEFAQAIVDEFVRYAVEDRGWPIKKTESKLPATTGVVDPDDVFLGDLSKVDLGPAELRKKLMLVPDSHDYDRWFKIGMSLHYQFDGSQEGLDLWHDWSSQAANYDREALDEKWPSFAHEGKSRQPLSAKYILKLAKEYEQVIAVEKRESVERQIASAQSIADIEKVCEEIQKIEFTGLLREQMVALVRDAYKRITKNTLSMTLARRMTNFKQTETPQAPEWLNGFVYMTFTNQFYHHRRSTLMDKKSFDNAYNRFMLTKAQVLEGMTEPEHTASAFALNAVQIKVVRNKMYMPGEDEIFDVDRQKYVNSYSDRNVPAIPKNIGDSGRAAIRRVLAHVEHMFANVADRKVLLDAIAFIVQNPGKRLTWAIMMQGVEGDGKSFFAGLLAAMLGPDNVNNVLAQAAEEKFTGWAEGAQVVFFEEIKLHGHNRYDVLNKVKPFITNPTASIRRMQTDVYSVINTASYFLTTNYRDALPLDRNDSRYFILFSRWQSKERLDVFKAENPDYYADLFGALSEGGALRKYFMAYDIPASFSAERRAPNSAARDEMISYAKTEQQEVLSDILEESTRIDMSEILLESDELGEAFAEKGLEVPMTRAMNSLLISTGWTQLGRFKVDGVKRRYWTKHPEKFTPTGDETVADLVRQIIDLGDL